MDSKKKQQYTHIGLIPISVILSYVLITWLLTLFINIKDIVLTYTSYTLFDIAPKMLQNIGLGQLSIFQSTISINNFSGVQLHHEMTSYIDLPINYFVSGIFYGMAFLGLIASFIIYQIFKERKWISYLSIQLLITLCFITGDILNLFHIHLQAVESFLKATILSSSIIFTGMLLSTYYPFGTKRFMYKNELKLYSLTSIIAIVLYFSSYLYGGKHSVVLDITVLVFFIFVQLTKRNLKHRKQYYLYVAFVISLCILLGLSFINLEIDDPITIQNHAMPNLKLYVSAIIVLSIINNYVLVRKNQKHNVRNRVFMFQYVLMLKNYHKLLVHEKNTQTLKQPDTITLKDHQGDLSYHLKNNYKLTEREVDVLYLIWDGLTNKEIAHELSITISTTKYHISNIYLKLNVNSRSQVFALKDW
ncbi:helix-turn-helix domain-containing protein [Myroides odoratimimus]|uniref:Helix-turn-helix transcriptional regulator n=2 Tax=Myroides TaxID=76831 RepID=A0AAI8C7J3_9FLAO|nr:LuxR C-terminal-related transcriptional regulator [Myroides odoratimimus]ALU27599.1 helix-turn-helix transcriptional regulator [Myroides odoratimimus]MDM1035205.1 LuxR family transcriptional regulator [Myroides odoratimimus]MDM1038785.1 LuxR family transcriptional regulator [Myroides odoratimimus]MDM1052912.1 LuxR family transcriptional regulator [Myroides odoratimimus]MDM1460188.1 LuxR family transcriptional regulator [Myroides odoratimimus]